MVSNSFDSTCAETQILASNLSIAEVQDCMGDSDADQEHTLLKVLKQTCSNSAYISVVSDYQGTNVFD